MGIYQLFATCHYCDERDCAGIGQDIVRGRGASGKWIDSETPKRNWRCVEVFDREGTEICQMCEREEVRFAHVMEHGRLRLEVGCVCAAYMDGTLDKAASKARESVLKARPKRLENFMNLAKWKEGKNGNPYYTIKRSEHNPYTSKVILTKSKFDNKHAYRVILLSETGEEVDSYASERFLPSKEAAMRNAFDSMFPLRMPIN